MRVQVGRRTDRARRRGYALSALARSTAAHVRSLIGAD